MLPSLNFKYLFVILVNSCIANSLPNDICTLDIMKRKSLDMTLSHTIRHI